MISGAPAATQLEGPSCAGSLAEAPVLGLRELYDQQNQRTGFRILLSKAPASAAALLALGFTAPSVPFVDLGQLGGGTSEAVSIRVQ